MARFRIIKAQIREITRGENKGKKFADCTLRGKSFWDMDTTRKLIFDEWAVEQLSQYIPVDLGGKAPEQRPFPEEFEMNGCFATWKAPFPFYKKHMNNHPERGITAGDLVRDRDGNPILYTELRVFCRYEEAYNENGQMARIWCGKEDPESVGKAAFAAYCVPATMSQTPADVSNQPTPQNQPVNQPTPQGQPMGQPAPQQPNPQPPFNGAYQPQF